MELRRPFMILALAAAGVASACAGGDDTQPANRDASTWDAPSDSAVDGATGCNVAISPIPPSTFASPPAGEGQTMRVIGVAGGIVSGSGFAWTVTYADGTQIPTTMPQTGRADVIEFAVARAGSYRIGVAIDNSSPRCAGSVVVSTESGAAAARATYQARLAPPAGSLYPAQTYTFQLVRGVPSGDNQIMLLKGLAIRILPVDENGQALSGYVRLTRKDTGDIFEAPAGTDGASFQIPSAIYDVLVVPDDDRAPQLFADQNSDTLDGKTLTVTTGESVSGDLKLPDGGAVEGARVSLRDQDAPEHMPSSVALSDAAGHFALRARTGSWALAINPRAEHGLPQVLLPQQPGLQVASGGTLLRFDWASPAPRPMSLTVRDGSRAVAGVRVVIEAAAGSLDCAGSLTVGDGTPTPLNGTFRTYALTGGDGTMSLAGVPMAVYRATAVPPATAPGAAVTQRSSMAVTATGTNSFDLELLPKITVTGRVIPTTGIDPEAVSGARVLLVDRAADVTYPALMGAVDGATRTFSLAVNPSRQYSLVVLPSSPVLVGRTVLASCDIGSANTIELPDTVVPAGQRYAGVVKNERNEGIAGAIIRFHCLSCADPTTPVAETVSLEGGAFAVSLPEP